MLIEGAETEVLFGEASVLVSAQSLVNGGMIRVAKGAKSVEYIHILFDQHEIVFANGAPTESLFPGSQVLDGLEQAAREELFEIFPELATDEGWRAAEPILKPYEGEVLAASLATRRPTWRKHREKVRQAAKLMTA